MRPIEFRGKRIDNGEWVYGYLVEIQDLRFAIKDTVYNVNNGRIDIIPSEVNPSTVGQFTGLKDKNGKKIFEGDIINARYAPRYEKRSFVVQWNEWSAAFVCYREHEDPRVKFEQLPLQPSNSMEDIEIIGNIHDNPELLNQQQ